MSNTHTKTRSTLLALVGAVCLGAPGALAQQTAPATGFEGASRSVEGKLQQSLDELESLYAQLAAEKIPLNRQLNELEAQLSEVRAEFQGTSKLLESRTLDLSNLRNEIKSREEESSFLANLFDQYIRNFESGLHIAEDQRYEAALRSAKLAPENTSLSELEVFRAQAELLDVSLGRLEDAVGGARFEGSAVDSLGLVTPGRFVLVGPAAFFRADDGHELGTAEQRLGSLEPTIFPFGDPLHVAAADEFIKTGKGSLPLDPTLGNAHKVEATDITLLEEVGKGGAVMIPIFVLASAALLVALLKWISLLFVRKPSRRRMAELLAAVGDRDMELATERVAAIRGPAGAMLATGLKHVDEPRELVEELMYESVLTSRLKLERWLPFIAISAASAPLLGLLGTVTGIINTFKLITVFGSGDVKSLSGGISEALITTKYGLIVAIPSLLMHAFLSRKAKGVVNEMETAAVSFVNQISKTPLGQKGEAGSSWSHPAPAPAAHEPEHGHGHERKQAGIVAPHQASPAEVGRLLEPDPELVRAQVKQILEELLAKQDLGGR